MGLKISAICCEQKSVKAEDSEIKQPFEGKITSDSFQIIRVLLLVIRKGVLWSGISSKV